MNFCHHLLKRLDKKRHRKRGLEIKLDKLLKLEDKKNNKKEQKKILAVKISEMINQFYNYKILVNYNKLKLKIIIRFRIKIIF